MLHLAETMDDLMQMIDKFCQLEDLLAEHAATCPPQQSKPAPAQHNWRQVNIVKTATRRPAKPEDYVAETTVFKETIYIFLRQIREQPFFTEPTDKLGETHPNPRAYCSYHREKGNYTTGCAPYKAYLEQLVRQGHLDNFIDRRGAPAVRNNATPTSKNNSSSFPEFL